jgi:hypothetical protein
MNSPATPPPRSRLDVILERVVIGIVLFLAITSVAVRLWLMAK